MPRLVAASILGAFLLVGCRTAMPPDPARLAAIEGELGSLLLVGFRGTEAEGNADLEDLLCETRVGGILLFARNIVDAEQLARLAEAATTRSAACTARRLFVAVDAEGGNVMRLAPGAGWSPTISAQEITNAINAQNLILPAGSTKIGKQEYQVKLNSSPEAVTALNNLPIKTINGATVFII